MKAHAFIDGEINLGKSSTNWSGLSGDKKVAGSALAVAAHFDPPFLPMSFGLRAYSNTYEKSGSLKLKSSGRYLPEVTAWLPLGDIAPFARVGYFLTSRYTESTQVTSGANTYDVNIDWKGAGPAVAAGIKYNILPLIEILASYEQTTEKLVFSSASGAADSGIDYKSLAKDFTAKTNTFYIGVSAGI
jgi:hypothetical protein